ncbi:DUF488 domain-containing protein [Lentzea sp. NPDC003310]|uniref:DUF488 domain-containing protein n=1 Tax=Lentzea sp. NPDC003310 TaxID=3154447 RepID=UPI0033AEB510
MTRQKFLTAGHSTHDLGTFAGLLLGHGVTAVADVRSTPFSRFAPRFNRHALERALSARGIKYVFLGAELGARPTDPGCYAGGRVSFARLAASRPFTSGIDRLRRGARTERIAVVCAEGEPLDCHRTVLVSRVLADGGADVEHLHGDGRAEPHAEAMLRLMATFGLADEDLFRTHDERLADALRRQEARIAHPA